MAKIIEFNVQVEKKQVNNELLEETKNNILEMVDIAKVLRRNILMNIFDLLEGKTSFDLCDYEIDKTEVLVLNSHDELVTKNVWNEELEMNWMSHIYKIELLDKMLVGYWSYNANEWNYTPFNQLKIEELLLIYSRMYSILSSK